MSTSFGPVDRKSTRLNSSHLVNSYAVFCLKKKIRQQSLAAVFRKQRQRPGLRGAILQNLDRPPPCQFLRVVDLAEVQHVPLHHAPPGDPRVLDNAPVAVLLAILRRTLQRKNMMAANYRHIGGLENRLGRHYSRFSTSWPAAPLAAQSLARRKLPNHGSNRPSQANLSSPIRALRGN